MKWLFNSTERGVTVNLEKYMYFEGKYIKFASDAWLVGKKNRSFEIDAFICKYSIYSGLELQT